MDSNPSQSSGSLGSLRDVLAREKVQARLGPCGKEVVALVSQLIVNPPQMKALMEGLDLKPVSDPGEQVEAIWNYINRNGKRLFLQHAEYDLAAELRKAAPAPAASGPQRKELIDTFSYRGPDRREGTPDRRRHQRDRREHFQRTGDNRRHGRDRRQSGQGRRKEDHEG